MNDLDISLFHKINVFAGKSGLLDFLGIFLAKYGVYFLALFLMFKWFQKRREDAYREVLLLTILVFCFSEVIGKLAGSLYSRLQPFAVLPEANQLIEKSVGNSFPSDHTILVFSFLLPLFLYTSDKWRSLYLITAVSIALARIFVGVHYPSDILASFVISASVTVICSALSRKTGLLSSLLKMVKQAENLLLKKISAKGQHSKQE